MKFQYKLLYMGSLAQCNHCDITGFENYRLSNHSLLFTIQFGELLVNRKQNKIARHIISTLKTTYTISNRIFHSVQQVSRPVKFWQEDSNTDPNHYRAVNKLNKVDRSCNEEHRITRHFLQRNQVCIQSSARSRHNGSGTWIAQVKIIVAIMTIACPVTILLSHLVIIAVKTRRELKKNSKSSNVLSSSMALADLLMGAVSMPLTIT